MYTFDLSVTASTLLPQADMCIAIHALDVIYAGTVHMYYIGTDGQGWSFEETT